MALFRRRRKTPIHVHLSVPLQPMHRGARFEDPIQAALDGAFPGSLVSGGGSAVSEEYRLTGCFVDLDVASSDVEAALRFVGDQAYQLGASRGSWVNAVGGQRIPLGGTEAFSIRVPSYGMDEIEHERDGVPTSRELDKTMRALASALDGVLFSWRMNPHDTDIFMVAQDLDGLEENISSLANGVPLLKDHTIVRFS
jgi:hypothetical protein